MLNFTFNQAHRKQDIKHTLYILEIDSSVFKSVQVSFILCSSVQNILKNNYRVAMTNMT